MKLRPIQKSFKSGEISPKLLSQVGGAEYIEGVERMMNYITTPYGSAQRRFGSRYVNEVSDTLTYGRIFTFRVEGSNTFVVVVTEDFITIYNKSAAELAVGGFLSNPDFNLGSISWNSNIVKASPSAPITTEPTITFLDGKCTIDSGNAAEIDIDIDGEDTTVDVDINASSSELTQEVTITITSNEHTLTLATLLFDAVGVVTDYLSIGTTEGDNDISFVVDPMDSNKVIFTPGVTTFWVSYKLNWDDSNDVTIAGRIVPAEGGHVGTSAVASFDSFSLVDTDAGGDAVVSFTSPYSEEQIRELQVEKAPGQSIMYFAVRASFVTKKLLRDKTAGTWTFIDVTFSNPPAGWAADGYPGSVTFHQGRMWLAGTVDKSITLWGSVSGEDNYEDFDVGTAQDNESIELPLARDGVIQWIQGGKSLHVGTDTAEHVIVGENINSLLTPTSARSFQQSSYGSFRIHGKWISEKVSFVSNDQRRVYIGDYDRETLGFLSEELSYKAEHITAPGIIESDYAQNPRARVWCVKSDGEMVGCTYQRETESAGWFRHSSPGGLTKSVTVTEEFGASIVWVLIVRQNKLLLEKQGIDVFVDSHVVRQYSTAQTTVDGLDHLEGLIVDVVGDGAFMGRHSVLSGAVTVPYAAQTFQAGLRYRSEMITLPVEVLNQTDNLTSKIVRWNKIYARIISSVPPIINGVQVPVRTAPTPMDTREPNKTEDVAVSTIGWDRDGKISIDQDLPFPCEIVGLFGELSEDGF